MASLASTEFSFSHTLLLLFLSLSQISHQLRTRILQLPLYSSRHTSFFEDRGCMTMTRIHFDHQENYGQEYFPTYFSPQEVNQTFAKKSASVLPTPCPFRSLFRCQTPSDDQYGYTEKNNWINPPTIQTPSRSDMPPLGCQSQA